MFYFILWLFRRTAIAFIIACICAVFAFIKIVPSVQGYAKNAFFCCLVITVLLFIYELQQDVPKELQGDD